MLAAETGNVDMIETLIRYRADLNMVSDLQESALMIACLRKQWLSGQSRGTLILEDFCIDAAVSGTGTD
jgi:hypothetical protein